MSLGPTPTPIRVSYLNHVFHPASRSIHSQADTQNGLAEYEWLAGTLCTCAHTAYDIIDDTYKPQWRYVTKMLDFLKAFLLVRPTPDQVTAQLCGMEMGDGLVFLNRFKDAALVLTRQGDFTLCISVQTSVRYAWAGEIPNEVFNDASFLSELVGSLFRDGYCSEYAVQKSVSAEATFSLLTDIFREISSSVDVSSVINKPQLAFTASGSPSLLIKLAIRIALGRGSPERGCYKVFILHWMCTLAMDALEADLSSELLHAISCKILRRLSKLGSSAPDWLRRVVINASLSLREILDSRWRDIRDAESAPSSQPWDPSQLDFNADTQLSLAGSKEYVYRALASQVVQPLESPFYPLRLPRRTLEQLMSLPPWISLEDHYFSLYDIERAVEQEFDDWLTRVTNTDKACFQIEYMLETYMQNARHTYSQNPELISIMILTGVELWVALDRLVLGALPMLSNYPPPVPRDFLHLPMLLETTKLHRLRRAQQYISSRHSRFLLAERVPSAHMDIFTVCEELDLRGSISMSVPSSVTAIFGVRWSVFTKWEHGARHLLHDSYSSDFLYEIVATELSHLKSCRVEQWETSFTGSYILCYGLEQQRQPTFIEYADRNRKLYDYASPTNLELAEYVNGTCHSSNEVLAARCPGDYSPQEFTAFGHLRSGGSLQWFNILRELHTRTLNFRHHDVYFLITKAASQAGPFDTNTTDWIWHQELQESPFCHALLDELEDLLMDVAVHSQDGVMMGIISFLLTRLLASSPSADIWERSMGLLRRVRRKTFDWVQEISYDLMMAPTNIERKEVLRDMAATCRSTFDVGPNTTCRLAFSEEDVAVLLFCAILIYANRPKDLKDVCAYSRVLLERDRRLSLDLENALRDIVETNVSNRGIDLAVSTFWPGYRPGPRAWWALPYLRSHWVTCQTAPTIECKRPRAVHLNLLDGALMVDGKGLDVLPDDIMRHPTYRWVFGDLRLLVIASSLPGMDYSTLSMIYEHRVHFAVRDSNLVIRAQHKDAADILEVIPIYKLQDDFPWRFINGHVHWLNLSTSIMEIRPLTKVWEQSPDNWKVEYRPGQHRMYGGREWLVDIRSQTYDMIWNLLRCLDTRQNIIITTVLNDISESLRSRQLSVLLPRYGLSFFMNSAGELESHDFEGLVYDEDQYIGTLFGLENRLVLRPNFQVEEGLVQKCVIIPEGQLSRREDKHCAHITTATVQLAPGSPNSISTQPVTYYTYRVDTDLNCLSDDSSWRSKIYLAHLHIQASIDWMPDPLTGRSGIQQALHLLRSACCRSPTEFDAHYAEFEHLFSATHRMPVVYPQLSFATEEILYVMERDKFLRGGVSDPPQRPKLDVYLAIKAAYLFPSEVIESIPVGADIPRPSKHEGLAHTAYQLVTLEQLFRDRSAPELLEPSLLQCSDSPERGRLLHGDPGCTRTLNQLFPSLRQNETGFQRCYTIDLHSSARCAREVPCIPRERTGGASVEELRKRYVRSRDNYNGFLATLKKYLGPSGDPLAEALQRSGQWSQIMPDALVRCLSSTSPIRLSAEWKKCLVSLVKLLIQLQQSRRLLHFSLDNHEELLRELESGVCNGWSAEERPDWLLVQLQGNFLIREHQADVSLRIISPQSGENTAMQVNMGEGKSSVIIPICAATLADGKRLVRIIVPKAMMTQTSRVLANRLGGLLNRQIYHMHFSRLLTGKYDKHRIETIHELLSECTRRGGILVVQPEDILSLRLASMECQPSENRYKAASHALLELEKWTHFHAQDILDESDAILHPRFQVMYTIGMQRAVEGSPDRWIITQQVLRLVRKNALSLSHDLPGAIECERNTTGSFPRIRILRGTFDAGRRLISLIVNEVISGHLPSFNLRDIHRDKQLYAAIRDFISSKSTSRRNARMVEEHGLKAGIWDRLLLLRGLLACDVLLFSLAERRWRVDYGLSPARTTKLAVPYRAKDVPAPSAEFGHPDLTIVLTCLSYYYGGLSEEQLRTSFEILHEQDDPSEEYSNWLRDYSEVPEFIEDLSNVRIMSSMQWDKYIYPLFYRNQGAVDFYLSHVVFPKEAQDFPWKLVASSWDLAEARKWPVTGLSGTNDSKYLLPTSISQRDLNQQRGSNAKVLCHLLQPENNFCMLISRPNGERLNTIELLTRLAQQEPKVHTLLDVGAQILDLSNYQLAKAWLDVSSESDAAVYFNDGDEPMVLTKDGASRPLLSSPFAQRLDRCVVYLDEAHTRGTDLKFPLGSRAAVTLGPRVTKDRLTQGCMRMRKLGHGHSVMFLAPLEVDRNIRSVVGKDDQNITLTAADILCWAIHETWADIKQQGPHWAQQGINHHYRYDSWSRFCNEELMPEQLAGAWLQPELKSLSHLYAPLSSQPRNVTSYSSDLDDQPEIHQRCIDLGILQVADTMMEEEQEREVDREIEREREVQDLPFTILPENHFLHPHVVEFVTTGVITAAFFGNAFHPIDTALKGSTAALDKACVWSPFVLATSDFCETVDPMSCQGITDLYLRPVQWVLSGKYGHNPVLVLLSPFEADCLMSDIKASSRVHLHVYIPRTSKLTRIADDLTFYSIPAIPEDWSPPVDLIDQLNVFAGQLYMRDYKSYLRLLRFLGIQSRPVLPQNISAAVRHNRITPRVIQEVEDTFKDSQLPLVMKLLVIRRRGQSFAQTHMGRILQGQQLAEEDFGGLARNLVARDHDATSVVSTRLRDAESSLSSERSKRGREWVDSDQDPEQPVHKRLRGPTF